MKFIEDNTIYIRQSPSVIDYINKLQLYIIGCYQLISDQNIDDNLDLKRINNRLGCLLLFDEKQNQKDDHECFDGGVFDIKFFNDDLSSTQFAVAHSNGFVAIYSIELQKIQLIKRINSESSLLTCLEMIDKSILCGDSEGHLIHVKTFENDQVDLQKIQLTKFNEQLWCINAFRIKNEIFVFVGSDDCYWRVFQFDNLCLKYTPIFTSKCNAGVTSFACVTSFSGTSFACATSFSGTSFAFVDNESNSILLVGSYDEQIRYYDVNLESNLNFTLKHKLVIPGSGIWKMKINLHSDKSFFVVVSGMYSGCHIIKDDSLIESIVFDTNENQEKELIYACACNASMKNLVVSSFYKNKLSWFKLKE